MPTEPAGTLPAEIRHEWYRNRERGAGVYECPHCHVWTANVPLYFNEVCEARDRRKVPDRRKVHSNALALAIRLLQERQAQHKAALAGWKEPDGHLVPTEPDPEERQGIRAMLSAAIVEDGYALGAMGDEAASSPRPSGEGEGGRP